MPRRETACAGSPVMSRPLNRMRPPDGGSTPVSRLKNVVLPAPLGPMTERSSPARTWKSTRLTAVRPPKVLVRAWLSSSGAPPPSSRRRARRTSRSGSGRWSSSARGRGDGPAPPDEPGQAAHDAVGEEEDDQHEGARRRRPPSTRGAC